MRPLNALSKTSYFRSFFLLNLWLWAAACAWLAYYKPPYILSQMIVFNRLIYQQDMPALWVTGGVLILAFLLLRFWRDEYVERLLGFIECRLVFICGACFVFYAMLAVLVYQQQPLAMDEYCIVLQSQIFATGKLAGQVPVELLDFVAYKPFQAGFLTVNSSTGQWMATYWPGTALLMTPFTFIGAPWLFNPAVSALTIYFLHRLAKLWTGSTQTAGWVVLFTLVSPAFVINAAGFYSMPSHMLLNVLFCLLLCQNTRSSALGAGVVGGFALILHNPLPHLAFMLPWFVYFVMRRRNLIIPLVMGYLIFGVAIGIGWILCLSAVSGSGGTNTGQSSNGIIASLSRVLALPNIRFLESRISGLVKLLLWASPGLLLLCFAAWKRGVKGLEIRVLGFSLMTTFLAYLVVRFDQGHGWGFRYLHSAWFALPMIGAAFLTNQIVSKTAELDMSSIRRYCSLCAIFSLMAVVPCYAVTTHNFITQQKAQIPQPQGKQRGIIFIRTKHGYYIQDLAQNDPFLRNSMWRLISRDEKANARIARKYLPGAQRVAEGKWGEMWIDSSQH